MNPAQTRLARRRLVLGITNVGFWVLAACAGLVALSRSGAGNVDLVFDGLILAGAVVVQAAFDLVGGFFLMPAPQPTVDGFLRGWCRGACGHTAALAGIGLLSYASFRASGGFVPAVVLATAGLAIGRRWALGLVGGVGTVGAGHDGGEVLAAGCDDPAFTGGIVGWGRRAVSLLPARWLQELPGGELAVESARRSWQITAGLPGRTILLVLGWNVAGAVTGSLLFGLAARPAAGALLLHACWMTLWAFGSLLILPSLSRRSVFAADRAVLDAGLDPRNWIARFPGIVGEDGGANGLVQTIFYPVPSARLRSLHLEEAGAAGPVPGSLARANLYYSWATCTLLGRAVHCNVGRPALWVFPPSA